MNRKYKWHKIADNMEEMGLSSEGMIEIEVSGKRICVVFNRESLHACAAKCPHAGGNMSHGYVDALGNIVCPLHRYKFALANGRNVSGEGYFLKTYPIEKRENGIFIGIESGGIFNW